MITDLCYTILAKMPSASCDRCRVIVRAIDLFQADELRIRRDPQDTSATQPPVFLLANAPSTGQFISHLAAAGWKTEILHSQEFVFCPNCAKL